MNSLVGKGDRNKTNNDNVQQYALLGSTGLRSTYCLHTVTEWLSRDSYDDCHQGIGIQAGGELAGARFWHCLIIELKDGICSQIFSSAT